MKRIFSLGLVFVLVFSLFASSFASSNYDRILKEIEETNEKIEEMIQDAIEDVDKEIEKFNKQVDTFERIRERSNAPVDRLDSSMDKGIHIGYKNSYLESSSQKAGELQLLGRGDGSEVMLQKARADSIIFILIFLLNLLN